MKTYGILYENAFCMGFRNLSNYSTSTAVFECQDSKIWKSKRFKICLIL